MGMGLYTWRWEPHFVEVVEHQMPIPNLPQSLTGARIVQLSDLHIGPRVDDSYLIRTFSQVKELAPEIVVYTGDFTSFELNLFPHAQRVFGYLPRGRMATLAVLGNHDYGLVWSQLQVANRICELAADAGVKVLRNEVEDVAGLKVVGLDDLWADQFQPAKVFDGWTAGTPAVTLSHNPDTADLPVWGDFDSWILAGHTHGGQCKPPFLPPPLLPVKNRLYTAGEFALEGGRRMYINRGIGHLLRVRFNVRPEITVFHLERA